ncbi:MAG: hypothetical protein ABL925_04845 [Methylococcales bacterium]
MKQESINRLSTLDSPARRNFIVRSALLVAGTAISLNSDQLGESPAYTAWKQLQKGSLTDLEYIVQCGTLAANAHNTQCWLFHISGGQIVLFADLKRNLGRADPKRRLMLMSLGCAVENMVVAAHQLGYQVRINDAEVAAFLADHGRCAVLELSRRGDSGAHPWFSALFSRRTARLPFAALPSHYRHLASKIGNLADLPGLELAWYDQAGDCRTIVNATERAVKQFVNDNAAYSDAMRWFRRSRLEWEHLRDGISIFSGDAPFWIKEWVNLFVENEDLLLPVFREGEVDVTQRLAAATPLWALVTAERNEPGAWFRAGRLVERLYLAAAAAGYAVQPVVYPTESATSSAELTTGLALEGHQIPLLLLRVGRAAVTEPSPRRDLMSVLI